MEIKNDLNVTDEQLNEMEMHSVLNIFNVISSQLHLLESETDHPDLIVPLIDQIFVLADAAKQKNQDIFNQKKVNAFQNEIFSLLAELDKLQTELNDGSKVSEFQSIFRDIFNVFQNRLEEIFHRWDHPDRWESFKVHSFKKDFQYFFYTMEKNSRGRYRIITNIVEQEEVDYLVQLEVKSDYKNTIYLPILLKDAIRDLVANARKYTPPGGQINIGIMQKEDTFKFVVKDSGYGIPKDEILKIIQYSYRASNIKDKVRTMGGGFGLTKAYHTTKKFGGRFWIESKLNEGTKISIDIPIPAHILLSRSDG